MRSNIYKSKRTGEVFSAVARISSEKSPLSCKKTLGLRAEDHMGAWGIIKEVEGVDFEYIFEQLENTIKQRRKDKVKWFDSFSPTDLKMTREKK